MGLENSIPIWKGSFRGHRSPLSYFIAHYGRDDLTRTEFAGIDSFAYKVLLNYRLEGVDYPMIKDAIPDRDPRGGARKRLSVLDILGYLGAFTFFKGDEHKAAKFFGVSYKYVRGFWREYNLISCRKSGRREISKLELKRISRAYRTFEGNATLTGKELGHSPDFIIRCWRKKGFKIRRPGQRNST